MAFRCQKCSNEIEIDPSLEHISGAQAKLLITKVPKLRTRESILPHQHIPKDRLNKFEDALKNVKENAILSQDYTQLDNVSLNDAEQSFVYISDSEEPATSTVREHEKSKMNDSSGEDQLPDFSKIKTLNQVFEILLINQDIDHPMCSECADLLTDNYKLKFDQSQREKEYYISFLRKLKDRENDKAASERSLDSEFTSVVGEVADLKATETSKLAELKALEAKHENLKHQLESINDQLENSSENQLSAIYRAKNLLAANLEEKERKLDQTKVLFQKQSDHLDALRQFNVFKQLYNILFEGDYGIINDFRLGHKIPWPECNAALGQIISLLEFLKTRLGLTIENYKFVPLGSKSYLLKQQIQASEHNPNMKAVSILPLHSSNEFSLGKLFNFNKLDVSMMALLDVLVQFEKQLIEKDSELAYPYKVSVKSGTIGGKSIRVTSNGQWTGSCRYLLVNLNWILSYTSAQLNY